MNKHLYLWHLVGSFLSYLRMLYIDVRGWWCNIIVCNVHGTGEEKSDDSKESFMRNSIQEEIKSRLKSENICYHSVKNILSSSLLSKYLKTKIYGTIVSLVILYGCETWSFKLREERRLKMFENRMPRRIFGPKMDEVTMD